MATSDAKTVAAAALIATNDRAHEEELEWPFTLPTDDDEESKAKAAKQAKIVPTAFQLPNTLIGKGVELFESYDVNGDKWLSAKELKPVDRNGKLMARLDIDMNKGVCVNEFLAFLDSLYVDAGADAKGIEKVSGYLDYLRRRQPLTRSQAAAIAYVFECFDENEDGALSAKEIATIDPNGKLMRKADADGDSSVDLDELTQYFLAYKRKNGDSKVQKYLLWLQTVVPFSPEERRMVETLFFMLDGDKNGWLDAKEITRKSLNKTGKFLVKLDGNTDGRVQRSEWDLYFLKLKRKRGAPALLSYMSFAQRTLGLAVLKGARERQRLQNDKARKAVIEELDTLARRTEVEAERQNSSTAHAVTAFVVGFALGASFVIGWMKRVHLR